MIYAVEGALRIEAGGKFRHLMAGEAVAVALDQDVAQSAAAVRLASDEAGHFVVLSGPALNEPIARHGPFVMNTREQLEDRIRAFQDGEFGQIVMPKPVER